ncbi:uroporphyrinogen-III synthase [Apibacter sp. HY039]|uniref:uroporphyrinogen-III synthase n=1 Tax=Apibacter sp. HY039 TaxID=2501476 RepID=UPI000FEBC160|nr:uroporphyrinogen-III synthase [Apibacter sp. HY039]
MKIKSVLISQVKPAGESSPYFDLEKKHKIKIDFMPFIHVQGADAKDVRIQKIDFSQFTAVIFTSRNAIDHFFRLAEEMRFAVPDSMKYVCQSETIALYLQRYIVYRKRKIYFGEKEAEDMIPLFKKNPDEKYLLPTSDILNQDIPDALNKAGINWTRAILFSTVSSDIASKISNIDDYDALVFFSPSGIKSLFDNYPDFKQNETIIGTFGVSTKQTAEEAGLKVEFFAPTKESPSMAKALDDFLD